MINFARSRLASREPTPPWSHPATPKRGVPPPPGMDPLHCVDPGASWHVSLAPFPSKPTDGGRTRVQKAGSGCAQLAMSEGAYGR